jgi:hypothetical protein
VLPLQRGGYSLKSLARVGVSGFDPRYYCTKSEEEPTSHYV